MSAEASSRTTSEAEDTAGLIQTIIGELMVVDQRLKHISAKTNSADVLLVRRFVAMAAEAALALEKSDTAQRSSLSVAKIAAD